MLKRARAAAAFSESSTHSEAALQLDELFVSAGNFTFVKEFVLSLLLKKEK